MLLLIGQLAVFQFGTLHTRFTGTGYGAFFSRDEDGSYKYAIGEKDGDLRQFVKEMNAALNGRGGGRPFFAQGSVKATEEEIRRFFRQ